MLDRTPRWPLAVALSAVVCTKIEGRVVGTVGPPAQEVAGSGGE